MQYRHGSNNSYCLDFLAGPLRRIKVTGQRLGVGHPQATHTERLGIIGVK